MSRLTILKFPDPRLRNKALPVTEVTGEIDRLVEDMFHVMREHRGIGLAAVQVGVSKQVIVIDCPDEKPLVLINPRITHREGEQTLEEGCLSLPGEFESVNRAEKICCLAWDRSGVEQEIEATGLLSVCIQHEIDHLYGRLFIDRLSGLKKARIGKRLKKQQRATAGAVR